MQPVSPKWRVGKKFLMMMYKTSLSDMFFVLQILDILLFHTTEWTAEAKQWQYIHEAKYVACYVTTCNQIIFDFFLTVVTKLDTPKSDYRESTGTEWLVLGLGLGLGSGLVVS